jgi:hypothetical protein
MNRLGRLPWRLAARKALSQPGLHPFPEAFTAGCHTPFVSLFIASLCVCKPRPLSCQLGNRSLCEVPVEGRTMQCTASIHQDNTFRGGMWWLVCAGDASDTLNIQQTLSRILGQHLPA